MLDAIWLAQHAPLSTGYPELTLAPLHNSAIACSRRFQSLRLVCMFLSASLVTPLEWGKTDDGPACADCDIDSSAKLTVFQHDT